jgi:hypothetical protein
VILRVVAPEPGRVVVETSDGRSYHANLSSFSRVYCYPASAEAWSAVTVDAEGLGLIWTSRFEVHVDQIIGLADRVEVIARIA